MSDCVLIITGVDIIKKALRVPCYTIASNAGVDAQDVVTRVMQAGGDQGYDAMKDEFVDMIKTGIIDPTKVWSNRELLISKRYDQIRIIDPQRYDQIGVIGPTKVW